MMRISEKLVLKKGAEIVCSHCRLYIARTVKDIGVLTKLKRELFCGTNITAHGPTKCPRCGSSWYLPFLGRIHTRQGWWPNDDEMMDLQEGKYNINH